MNTCEMNTCENCKTETSEYKLSGIVLKVDEEYLLIKEPASNRLGFPKGYPKYSKYKLATIQNWTGMVKDDNASCLECAKCCAFRHFYEETGIKLENVSYKQIELGKNLGTFFVISLDTKPSIDIKTPVKTLYLTKNKLKSMNREFNLQALKIVTNFI